MQKLARGRGARRRTAKGRGFPESKDPRLLWESLVASHDDVNEGLAVCAGTRAVFVSDGFCRLTGRSRREVLAMRDLAGLFPGRESLAGFPEKFESRLMPGGAPGPVVEVSVKKIGPRRGLLLVLRDITWRTGVEEQLKKSEETRVLFQTGSDAMLLMRGSVFIDANERALSVYGVSREELIGKTPFDFSPARQPDGGSSYEKWESVVAAALAGQRQLFEWQQVRSDRSLFDVEISLNRVEIAGEPLTQATVRDITDRKRAEDALRKYEFIANTTGSLMTLVDREYRYVAANNAYCLAQGKERTDLIGRTMGEVWGQDLFEATLRPAVDACLLGRTVNYEATFRFPSDRVKIYDVTYSPYWQHEGGWYVTHVVVVSHDITDRRLAEQTLTREEARLKANLHLSQMLDSSITEMCAYALTEGTRLTGSSAGYFATLNEDRRTASVLAIFPGLGSLPSVPEERGDVQLVGAGKWADTLRRRSHIITETAVRAGEKVWPVTLDPLTRTLHIPVLDGETVVALAGVANKEIEYTESDIHQLSLFWSSVWQILQQKKGRDQLRTSLDEKEVLLKEIHHRVKNNLQVISSLLNLQSNYVRDENDMEIFRESQNRIRSMALIHEKLYQSGDVSNVDFPQYARSLANTLFRSYRSAESNIQLEVDFGDVSLGIDAAVPCGLIINELLSNALKHAFPGGRGGTVLLGLRAQGGTTRLTVKDDGIGFPAGLDVARPDSLGLQLVNTLVAQIGGVLEVERKGGTEFRIAFTTTERRHRL